MSRRFGQIHMREVHEAARPYFDALERVTGIPGERVIGYRRHYSLTDARCVLAYLLRNDLGLPWPHIAEVAGRHANNRMALEHYQKFVLARDGERPQGVTELRCRRMRRWYAECVELTSRIEAFEDAA